MKGRTIHPAEFAGWSPSMVDAALWETILWSTTDWNGEPLDANHDLSAAWREDMEQLSEQFYSWKDSADSVMIAHGFGDWCLEELLGPNRVEHCYALVRDEHGVSMTDRWQLGSPEYACCLELERLAVEQGPIGAYVGDGGRIYLACCP
jgi:hypothetical protein